MFSMRCVAFLLKKILQKVLRYKKKEVSLQTEIPQVWVEV